MMISMRSFGKQMMPKKSCDASVYGIPKGRI
jgi:hypothetical protein